MGQASSTPFGKADLLGAGTVEGRTVPLTFAPPRPALCAHDAHGLCVCGVGGRGWLTRVCRPEHHQLRKQHPNCNSRGRKGPSCPAARGQRPGPGMGSSPQRLPGKEGSWSSGSSSHGRLYSRTEFSLPSLLLMRSNCFPSFFYQNSGSRLGREPFSPKKLPDSKACFEGGSRNHRPAAALTESLVRGAGPSPGGPWGAAERGREGAA